MKVIRTAALIVGAVALVATGVGAVIGAGAFAATFGVSLGLVSAIGSIAGIVAQLTAPKPKNTVGGSLTDFKLDPTASVPIMLGRTYHAGNIVHRDTWGAKNKYQGFVVVYSGCGPVAEVEGFYIDMAQVKAGLSSGSVTGANANFAYFAGQRGLQPEPAAVPSPIAGFPGWTAAHKLSGMCAGIPVFVFDEKGKKWSGGIPKNGIVGTGVLGYDPREDSTYPGGDGACRSLVESTYLSTKNPWILALTFALGYWQNGKRVGGVGVPIEAINVAAFVEAANIADVNGWEASGLVYTGDQKWDVLKMLAQAGGGDMVWEGARLSCTVSAPKVSVDTIRSSDLRGPVKIVGTQTRRTGRINTIIPVCRLEGHGWEEVPLAAIEAGTYVAEDGGTRTKEVKFPLAGGADARAEAQVAQLAAYEVVNGREFGPVSLKLGPEWATLAPGMAVDLDIPEAELDGQFVVLGTAFDPAGVSVNIELRSETPSKHPYALGVTTTAPPTPSLVPPDYEQIAVDFEDAPTAATRIRSSSARGASISAVDEGDGTATISVASHFRDYPDRSVTIDALVVAGAPLETTVFLYYDDSSRSDPSPVVLWTEDYEESVNDSLTAPFRHYLGLVTTPAAGGAETGGDPPPYPGGGGFCVEESTLIDVEGGTVRAADLAAGDFVLTRHERTLELGLFEVESVQVVSINMAYEALGLVASADHRIYTSDAGWVRIAAIGEPVGPRRVVKISVKDARTYVSNGLLSHNAKFRPDPEIP